MVTFNEQNWNVYVDKKQIGTSQSHQSWKSTSFTYHYVIFTGPRCNGLQSCRTYTTAAAADKAGKAMMKKLGVGIKK